MGDKTIAIILNTPALGGAERSMILQACLMAVNHKITFFIPYLNNQTTETQKLCDFINVHIQASIKYFPYPKHLYRLSRSNRNLKLSILPFEVIRLIKVFHKLQLKKFDLIWANGNKVAVMATIFSILMSYRGALIWHFRDYPFPQKMFTMLFGILNLAKSLNIHFVANSYSVNNALSKLLCPEKKIHTVYNPSGVGNHSQSPKTLISRIGIIAMMAPWKGLHQIVFWASMFENELQNLGIREINIYGGNIYKTDGNHCDYTQQLHDLATKFPSSLLNFRGLCSTSEIFKEIDLLIHPSISQEPFGRVITESYAWGIPIISTCLGGAGEILYKNKTGLAFHPHDHFGLYQAVETIVLNERYRNILVQNAHDHLNQIESSIPKSIERIIQSSLT